MSELRTVSTSPNPVEAHRSLSLADSAALNAEPAPILADHIGDLAILRAAIDLAKRARSGAGAKQS